MSKTVISTSKPYDAEFEVVYCVNQAFPGDLEQPPEPAYAEVLYVKPLERYSDEEGYNEWIEEEGYIDAVFEGLSDFLALPVA